SKVISFSNISLMTYNLPLSDPILKKLLQSLLSSGAGQPGRYPSSTPACSYSVLLFPESVGRFACPHNRRCSRCLSQSRLRPRPSTKSYGLSEIGRLYRPPTFL